MYIFNLSSTKWNSFHFIFEKEKENFSHKKDDHEKRLDSINDEVANLHAKQAAGEELTPEETERKKSIIEDIEVIKFSFTFLVDRLSHIIKFNSHISKVNLLSFSLL